MFEGKNLKTIVMINTCLIGVLLFLFSIDIYSNIYIQHNNNINQTYTQSLDISTLKSQISSLNNNISNLNDVIETQKNEISSLKGIIDRIEDEVNKQKIPGIIKMNYTPTSAVDYILNPFVDKLKTQYPAFSGLIENSKSGIAIILSKKIQLPDMTILSSNRINGTLYNTDLRLRFPVSLNEIPALAIITNVTGNITIYVDIIINVQVDVVSEQISNISYKSCIINI